MPVNRPAKCATIFLNCSPVQNGRSLAVVQLCPNSECELILLQARKCRIIKCRKGLKFGICRIRDGVSAVILHRRNLVAKRSVRYFLSETRRTCWVRRSVLDTSKSNPLISRSTPLLRNQDKPMIIACRVQAGARQRVNAKSGLKESRMLG